MTWLKTLGRIAGITTGIVVGVVVILFLMVLIIPRADHCVEVVNLSPSTIDSIALTGAGADESLGQLARLESVESCFHPSDGQLVIKYRDRFGPKEAVVEGYLTGGVDGRSKVVFEPDGSLTIHDQLSTRNIHGKKQ